MPLRKLLLTATLALAIPVAASAATVTSFGPRIGLSLDPDQLVIGGQINTSEIAKNITLNPNLEIGFGDDVTVVAVNFDGQYHFRVQGSDWRPYVGLGLGINFVSVDLPAPFRDESDTEIGLNVAVGSNIPTGGGNPLFGELRFMLGDGSLPGLKLMFGVNFGR
jgi:hypothetical protein